MPPPLPSAVPPTEYKIPLSVLVVIHTPQRQVLLLRRLLGAEPGQAHWQSVTGSLDALDEPWHAAAAREVQEETGFDVQAPGVVLHDWGLENVYPLYPAWRHRYAPGVFFNRERVFGLCLPAAWTPRLSPSEHDAYVWLEHRQAAQRCVSPSNAEAILWLSHGFAFEEWGA